MAGCSWYSIRYVFYIKIKSMTSQIAIIIISFIIAHLVCVVFG